MGPKPKSASTSKQASSFKAVDDLISEAVAPADTKTTQAYFVNMQLSHSYFRIKSSRNWMRNTSSNFQQWLLATTWSISTTCAPWLSCSEAWLLAFLDSMVFRELASTCSSSCSCLLWSLCVLASRVSLTLYPSLRLWQLAWGLIFLPTCWCGWCFTTWSTCYDQQREYKLCRSHP